MAEIPKTYHVDVRMNQRGITEEMLGLTLEYGDIQGDKFVTNRKNLKSILGELDMHIRQPQKLRKTALKLMDKGGISVVVDNGNLITTYNTDSYLTY